MPNNAQSTDPFAYLAEISDKFREEQKAESEEIYRSNEGDSESGLGFPVSEANGTYEPTHLNARHREILRLTALGYKQVQVAAMLSITPATVGYVVRSPLGQSFLAEIHEARTDSVKDVHNRLQEMSPFAAEIMLDIMANGKREGDKLRAAEKVLEMTGHKADNKHMHLHTHMTQEDIKEMKKNVKAEDSDEIEDAEIIDEDSRQLE